MAGTNFSKVRKIPTSVTTKKSAPTTTNFAKGIYTYKANDTMDFDEIYLAQNARFDRIGEYATRHGLKELTKIRVQDRTDHGSFDTTEYDLVPLDGRLKLPITQRSNINSVSLCVFTDERIIGMQKTGDILQLTFYEDDDTGSGINARSCVRGNRPLLPEPSTNLDTVVHTKFVFKDVVSENYADFNGAYIAVQSGGHGQKFWVACEPGTTTPIIKYETVVKGRVINVFESNLSVIEEGSGGTVRDRKEIFCAVKYTDGTGKICRVARDGSTGEDTLVSLRTLPTGVKNVRFAQVLNEIRYADGKEGPRRIHYVYEETMDWVDDPVDTIDLKTGTNLGIKVSNVMLGTEDNVIYFDADTTTQAVWTYPYGFTYAPEADYITSATLNEYVPGSTTTTTVAKSTLKATSDTHPVSSLAVNNLVTDDMGTYGKITSISESNIIVTSISHTAEPINSYDKFDRDFRQNFPAIATGDPLTAMFNLGGIVYFLTRHNKYYMYSQTADVWTQQASTAQHGTFSQESCVCDINYAYYACDDGIYVFDGSTEISITQSSIQSTYDSIFGKEKIILSLHNNRLYVFYPTESSSDNLDGCLVYNINLRLWESFDTGLTIGSAVGRRTPSNRLICGSSRAAQLFLYEDPEAEYADVGAPIDFDLMTSYLHFGTPSQLHRITKWRPEFSTVGLNYYAIKCGYALDFTNDVKYAFSIDLHNNKPVNEHYVWDNPSDYGNPVQPTKLTTIPQVNGQFYRCQIRYQLHSAYTPVNFKSHTLSCETQRLR